METVLVFRFTRLDCWREKFAGIDRFAQRRNWHLQIIEGEHRPSTIRELIKFWNPVGCIVEAGGGDSPLRPAHFKGINVVFLDQDPRVIANECPLVRHNSEAIARLAARELLKINPASYALVTWYHPRYWAHEKEQAFKSILEIHGKTCEVFRPRPCDRRANAITFIRGLSDWIMSLPKPCGIFGVNDMIAEKVLSAANALKLQIPEEVAIIGADNDPSICEATRPSLSSIRPDIEQTGYRAAECLANLINGTQPLQTSMVVAPLEVVNRQSTRLLKRNDRDVQNALEIIRRQVLNGLRASDVLAQAFTCSRRQAEMRFRELVGCSILEKIQETRFKIALDHLRRSDVPLSVVSDLSGWPSALVLRRFVKTRTGRTLGELRSDLITACTSVPSSGV